MGRKEYAAGVTASRDNLDLEKSPENIVELHLRFLRTGWKNPHHRGFRDSQVALGSRGGWMDFRCSLPAPFSIIPFIFLPWLGCILKFKEMSHFKVFSPCFPADQFSSSKANKCPKDTTPHTQGAKKPRAEINKGKPQGFNRHYSRYLQSIVEQMGAQFLKCHILERRTRWMREMKTCFHEMLYICR